MANFEIRYAPMFAETINRHPEIHDKLERFIYAKGQDPSAAFGKSDTPFIGTGPIGRTGLKVKHAHLSQDISIVYRIHGRNPHILELYGAFSHKELGISNTANIRQQKKVARKLQQQFPS